MGLSQGRWDCKLTARPTVDFAPHSHVCEPPIHLAGKKRRRDSHFDKGVRVAVGVHGCQMGAAYDPD